MPKEWKHQSLNPSGRGSSGDAIRGKSFLPTTKMAQVGSGQYSYRVDEQGMWLGAEQFDNAPARISMKGVATFNSINAGQYLRVVEPGTNTIQTAINELATTGGDVFLKAGVHVCTTDIVLPSDVNITGQGIDTTIIYFAGLPYCLKMQGTAGYSTGTVTISQGTTLLVGNNTVWSTNLSTTQSLKIGRYWYDVSSITDNTHLVLSSKYVGELATGTTYQSCTFVRNNKLEEFSLIGSGTTGIFCDYTNNILMERLIVGSNAGNGILMSNGAYAGLNIIYIVENGINGFYLKNFDHGVIGMNGIGYWSNGNCGLLAETVADTGFGITETKNNNTGNRFDNCYNCGVLQQQAYYNVVNGIEFINCTEVFGTQVMGMSNGSAGFYIKNSVNSYFAGVSASHNTTDGVSIDSNSDGCVVASGVMVGNGNYAVRILNNTCDNNLISSISCSNNGSGTILDAGTGTRIIW